MNSRTTLLTGIAALTLMSAPAFAQTSTSAAAPSTTMPSTQTPTQSSPAATPAAPSASATQTRPAAPATAPEAQPGTLQLQPGADVKGSDGVSLGKLEGVQNNAAGEQELTVRGADGQLRGVPLGGLKPEGAGVSVGWSSAEYLAAPAIPGSSPAPTPSATAPAASSTASPPTSSDPADATPATTQEPTTDEPATAPEPQQ